MINILPFHIEGASQEDIRLWSEMKSKTKVDPDTEVAPETFHKVYKEKYDNVTKGYLRGRKFYGETLPINDVGYKAVVFDKGQNGELIKNCEESIMVWEHEKLPSEGPQNGLQNQWWDIVEMAQVAEIIHK